MSDAGDNRLRLLVERIERLMEERAGISADIRNVFAEAKAVGYDAAILRKVIQRRAIDPAARDEADVLVATYENALAGLGDDPAPGPDARRAQAEAMAQAILAEQVAGLADPSQAAVLVEHVTVLLDIRAEIAELRRQEADRRKLAKQEGFEPNPLQATVRWIEKCAKHGADAMRAGEAVFHLYRGTVEGRGGSDAAPRQPDPAAQHRGRKPGRLDATLAWLKTGMGD